MNMSPSITRINPLSALDYLESTGWKKKKIPCDDIFLLTRKESKYQSHQIVLPKDNNTDSYAIDMAEAIKRVSDFEHRTFDDILSAFLNPYRDNIQYRFTSSSINNGELAFSSVKQTITEIIKMLRSAALDNVKKETYHERLSGNEIDEFEKGATFGQTGVGSFIINIFVPAKMNDDQLPMSNSFREALINMMINCNQLVEYIANGNHKSFIERYQDSKNFSANTIMALNDVRMDEDTEFEISVNFTPIFPVREKVPTIVRFKKEVFSKFDDIADCFIPKHQDSFQQFIGYVKKLTKTKEVQDENGKSYPIGDVEIETLLPDEDGKIVVTVSIDNYNEYNNAIRSFEKILPVAFEGIFKRHKRSAKVLSVKNFRIVEQ